MFVLKYIFEATLIVKAIFLILIIMSIFIWAGFLNKLQRIKIINNLSDRFEKDFWSGIVLEDFYEANKKNFGHPLGFIFKSVMKEWQTIGNNSEYARKRMHYAAEKSMIRTNEILEKYQIFFLSCVSIAPMLGLFGTICGIIDTFQVIGIQNDASISTVAPGVSEALVSTGLSILVAIFSAGTYNFFTAKANSIRNRCEYFTFDVIQLLLKEMGTNTGNSSNVEVIKPEIIDNKANNNTNKQNVNFDNDEV